MMVKIMKPSKRIYEIARELKEEIMKQDISLENKITALEESLTGAVMFYLDEEWEKEQRKSTCLRMKSSWSRSGRGPLCPPSLISRSMTVSGVSSGSPSRTGMLVMRPKLMSCISSMSRRFDGVRFFLFIVLPPKHGLMFLEGRINPVFMKPCFLDLSLDCPK